MFFFSKSLFTCECLRVLADCSQNARRCGGGGVETNSEPNMISIFVLIFQVFLVTEDFGVFPTLCGRIFGQGKRGSCLFIDYPG